jgi:NAD(P)-dependent dehydrogenase (short-subunit alcohol dehydrogenase family)
VLPHTVDVADEEAARAAIAAILPALGRIDILVNNAGIYPHRPHLPTPPFAVLAYAEWRHGLAVNLDSVVICTHARYPAMQQR